MRRLRAATALVKASSVPRSPDPIGTSPIHRILKSLPGGKRILIAAHKGGGVVAVDPDNKGAIVWKTDLADGPAGAGGQIMWGGAADDQNVYYSLQTGGVAAKNVERKAITAAAGDDFAEAVGQDTERLAERQCGGRRPQVGGEQQVVQQLGGLPRAQIAQVHDRVGIAFEHRTTPFDDIGVAADHHEQTALGNGRCPTAHWRVDDRDTLP